MTIADAGRTGLSRRDLTGLTLMAAGFVVGVLFVPSTQAPLALAGLTLLVGGTLLLEIELPWGGQVSLGHAVVIAFACRLSVGDFVAVVGLALVLVTLPELRRHGVGRGLLTMFMLFSAAGAGLLGRLAGNAMADQLHFGHRAAVVAPVLLAGVAYVGAIVLLQSAIPRMGGRPRGWTSAVNVYASLLCAAALISLASRKDLGGSPALAAVALIPLLVLRFSFRRYFDARRTYLQATQSLSMIPEVAGLTALGHGERTAVYAAALAEFMEFPPDQVAVAETVARLHHIGQIAHPDLPRHPYGPYPEERRLIGQASASILAQTGFLHDVAPLVAAVQAGEPWEVRPLEAVVRVASTLDDLVGEEASGLPDALVGLLARHDSGLERTVALKLAHLCDAHPEVADRAVAAGASSASAGADLGPVLSEGR